MTRADLEKIRHRAGWGYPGKPALRFHQAKGDVLALLVHVANLERAVVGFALELAPANDVGVGSAQPGTQAGRKGHG